MNLLKTIKNIGFRLKSWNPFYVPLETYNKVSDLFVKPKIKIYYGKIIHNWSDSKLPIHIDSFDVNWKDKSIFPDECNPSFENGPELSIIFFNRWQILLQWIPDVTYQDEDLYWETILCMTNYDMNIYDAIQNNVHVTYKWVKDSDEIEHPIEDKRIDAYTENLLTDLGKKEYERLKNVKNNN